MQPACLFVGLVGQGKPSFEILGVGRRDEKSEPATLDVTRLILTEPCVDELLGLIPKIEEGHVHQRARQTLKRLQNSASFRSLLQRGLKAPPATIKGKLAQLKVPAEKKEGEDKQGGTSSVSSYGIRKIWRLSPRTNRTAVR